MIHVSPPSPSHPWSGMSLGLVCTFFSSLWYLFPSVPQVRLHAVIAVLTLIGYYSSGLTRHHLHYTVMKQNVCLCRIYVRAEFNLSSPTLSRWTNPDWQSLLMTKESSTRWTFSPEWPKGSQNDTVCRGVDSLGKQITAKRKWVK